MYIKTQIRIFINTHIHKYLDTQIHKCTSTWHPWCTHREGLRLPRDRRVWTGRPLCPWCTTQILNRSRNMQIITKSSAKPDFLDIDCASTVRVKRSENPTQLFLSCVQHSDIVCLDYLALFVFDAWILFSFIFMCVHHFDVVAPKGRVTVQNGWIFRKVPNCTNQYCPILTQYHQIPASTGLYWPSTIIYQCL